MAHIQDTLQTPPQTTALLIWQRLRKNRLSIVGSILISGFLLLALTAPLIAPADPMAQALYNRLSPPTLEHPFGTDDFGRDILSRVIYGARISLRVGVFAVLIALILGTCIGVVAGYWGGWIDQILMRMMDLLLAFPSILLAIGIVAILGPGHSPHVSRRHRGYAAICAPDSRIRLNRKRNRLCHSRTRPGSIRLAHTMRSHLAQLSRPTDRPGDIGIGNCDSRRCWTKLSRPGRATPNTRMGGDAEPGSRTDCTRTLGTHLSRRSDLFYSTGI